VSCGFLIQRGGLARQPVPGWAAVPPPRRRPGGDERRRRQGDGPPQGNPDMAVTSSVGGLTTAGVTGACCCWLPHWLPVGAQHCDYLAAFSVLGRPSEQATVRR